MSIFYKSLRVGKNGKLFHLYKFRTMVNEADKLGPITTSKNDPRLTRTGKWLRKYKLDEIPNLLNCLRGEMVIIGPRPYIPSDFIDIPFIMKKTLLSVKPGIIDYATLLFHNEEEIVSHAPNPHEAYLKLIKPLKLRLGIMYIHNKSFKTNRRILWMMILLISQRILGEKLLKWPIKLKLTISVLASHVWKY